MFQQPLALFVPKFMRAILEVMPVDLTNLNC